MKRIAVSTSLATIIIATIFLTACPSRVNIGKVLNDPGRYRDKEVGLVGTVQNSYGVLGNGAYELDDGTGRIWVVTRRGVPARGSRVGARGRVYTGFSFAGRSLGTVLEEAERRSR